MVEKSHKGDEWHAKLCTAPYVLSTTNSVQGVRALSREYDTSRQQHQFWRILINLFVNKSHCKLSRGLISFKHEFVILGTIFVLTWVGHFTNDRKIQEHRFPYLLNYLNTSLTN